MAASLLAFSSLTAQTVYRCDFENPAEQSQWVLNKMLRQTALKDLWNIGQPGQFGLSGHNGLFISDANDGTQAVASGQQVYTVAVRQLNLAAGNYTFLCNYRNMSHSSAKLHIWWMPQSYAKITSNNGIIDFSAWTNAGGRRIVGDLYGSSAWMPVNQTFSITSSQTAGQLVIVWESAMATTPIPPAACVDDIEIIAGTPCAVAPTNLRFDKGAFQWNGSWTDRYEVLMYNSFYDVFDSAHIVTGNAYTPQLTEEGYCYIYVRKLCSDSTHSPWSREGTFVWMKGKRCIDYMDYGTQLSNAGVCYTGSHSSSASHSTLSFSNTPKMVDKGYASSESMHTLHYDRSETDPYSGGRLPTVPAGEVASVRLGAYTGSGEDARIEYKFRVNPGQSDLLDLKYACVLNSGGHGSENPFFQLEILDQRGRQIEGCTHAYFVADMTGSGGKWHQNGDTWWSDWDKVTVSLRNYMNQTLTIRLTASRCVFDTHFGYAYFTIGCRSGDLEGITCGDYSTDHFTAPAGFQYQWYSQDDPARTLSTDQVFNIDQRDTTIYVVDVISTVDGERCSYSLTANPNPRFPEVEVVAKQTVANCTNSVTFTNTSYVAIVNRLTHNKERSEEMVEEVLWDFGDGSAVLSSSEALVSHDFPNTGGTFNVHISASMSSGICVDDTVITLSYPDLLHTGSTRDTVHLCRDDYPNGYEYRKGHVVKTDTLVVVSTGLNIYGCDAPNERQIYFHESSYSQLDTNFCEGGFIDFHGNIYNETGDYKVTIPTVFGCDSTMALHLTVIPRLEVAMQDTFVVCADDPSFHIPYTVIKGRMGRLAVLPDSAAIRQGFLPDLTFQPGEEVIVPLPQRLEPGNYGFRIQLGTPDCPSDDHYIYLKVRYPSSIIAQKNDLIALLNADYNVGGWSWTGYQWYRNGVELAGANTSYIVVSDIDQGAEYYCLLMNADGLIMESCPIIYHSAHTALSNIEVLEARPTCLWPGETITLNRGGNIQVFDALGRLVSCYESPVYDEAHIPAPAQPGLYLIRQASAVARIIVK